MSVSTSGDTFGKEHTEFRIPLGNKITFAKPSLYDRGKYLHQRTKPTISVPATWLHRPSGFKYLEHLTKRAPICTYNNNLS